MNLASFLRPMIEGDDVRNAYRKISGADTLPSTDRFIHTKQFRGPDNCHAMFIEVLTEPSAACYLKASDIVSSLLVSSPCPVVAVLNTIQERLCLKRFLLMISPNLGTPSMLRTGSLSLHSQRSWREPNVTRVISLITPSSFKISPGDVAACS